MATDNRSAANKISNASVAMSTVSASMASSIPSYCNYILLSNADASINILVSFDAGTTWFTLKPSQALSVDCIDFKARNTLHAKSASGTPTLEMIFGAEV